MVKILIPRSNSISAKTIVPTDFEKYFDDVVNDYIISGFTVTATTGTNRSVDISTGTARVKGMFVNNDALETTAHTFGTDNTHYLYIQIIRDGNNEPESWSYTSNTTGTAPTDSIIIAKVITAAGDVSSIDQTIEFKKMSHIHTFVGTGTEIAALTTYAGMFVVCTVTGSGFTINNQYVRNTANTNWNRVPDGSYYFGSAQDGDLTVSSGTTTLTETKYYGNVTVAVGATLTGNNPLTLFVKGTLTVNGTVSMNGKGGAGGTGATVGPSSGGTAHPSGFGGGSPGGIGGTSATASTAGILGVSSGNGGAAVGGSGAGGAGGNLSPPSFNGGAGGASTNGTATTGSTGTLNRVLYNPFDWISTSPRPQGIGAGGGGGGSGRGGGGGGSGGTQSDSNSPGGAGGAGGSGAAGGNGGNGGGHLCIFAKNIIINSGGVISSNGVNGSNGANNPGTGLNGAPGSHNYGRGGGGGGGGASANGGSGGGGGSGGLLMLIYNNITNSGSITVTAGSGGSAGSSPGAAHGIGGSGGGGSPNDTGAGVTGTAGSSAPNTPGPTGVPGNAGTAGGDGIKIELQV